MTDPQPPKTPSSPGPHLSVHHVHVFVRDLDLSLRFFTEKLDFKVLFDAETKHAGRFVAVAPKDGSTILGLIAPQPGSPQHQFVGRSGHVVFVTDDIVAQHEHWSSRGLIFTHSPQPTEWSGVIAPFLDPDGNSFALMSHDDISRHLERQRKAVADRDEAERRATYEMEIAREFQAKLFPQAQLALPTIDFEGRCLQARQVGGDYFDCLPLDGNSVGLVIGDISGKGIAAALVMANLQAIVRSQSALAVHDPARFFHAVNRHLFENTTPAAYATMFFGEYDQSSGRVRYMNCGHPPALLMRQNGDAEELTATSTVLGLFASPPFSIGETHLDTGDTLVLYTDGVTECFDGNGLEFGVQRLLAIVRRARHLSAAALLDEIAAELLAFRGAEQQDDITLVIAKYRPDSDMKEI